MPRAPSFHVPEKASTTNVDSVQSLFFFFDPGGGIERDWRVGKWHLWHQNFQATCNTISAC